MRMLFVVLALISQYWEESSTVQAFRKHVDEICLSQNEGRAPGSEGEKAVASYVYSVLDDAGLQMLTPAEGDVFGIRQGNDTLVSRNVAAFVGGYDKILKDHYIIVGARMDNLGVNRLTVDGRKVEQVYTGANGNASGLAMLMELASLVNQHAIMLKRSVIFVAFGSSSNSFAGAYHFLHHSFAKDAKKIDAMVNLDMLGVDRDGMMAFTGGNEDLNLMINAVNQSLQPVTPSLIPMEPYPSDQQVFYAAEIPTVTFTTGKYAEHNTHRDTPGILDYSFMEREREYIYNFIIELANAKEGLPSFHLQEKKTQNGGVMAWNDCDVPPMFLNNPNPSIFLEKWVYPYLKYPQSCINDGIQGRVMVEFTIDASGRLLDAHVTRSVDPALDEAALKVINASPKWRPARHKGKKVACSMTIPVEFRLKKRK
ncbi:MAG: TonB family protein [Bacteroidales bacterium]|nr:TonB family protein [Bacteroidales bacterium]